MNKVLITIAVILLIACSYVGYKLHVTNGAVEELNQQVVSKDAALAGEVKARTAAESALKQRDLVAAQAKAHDTKASNVLNKAIAANPSWASQRVPDDIIDAISM